LEIVLVDLRGLDMEAEGWTEEQLRKKRKFGVLQDLNGKVNPPRGNAGIIKPQDIGLGEIPGFTDIVKIRKRM
jgi:hypothetical protein